jgi:hypothetical protein
MTCPRLIVLTRVLPPAVAPLAGLLVLCCSLAGLAPPAAAADEPPRFEVPAADNGGPLTFVVYGDTRFTQRNGVANAVARRSLVDQIAHENPLAVFIGGDLVYQGSDAGDYETYKSETVQWTNQKIAVFPALGNHEFRGCEHDPEPCLENWWNALAPLALRPYRWYSVSLGSTLLALVLDSDLALKAKSPQRVWLERQIDQVDPSVRFIVIVLHYPPVRDPIFPRARDEREVARYLAARAKSLHAQVVVVGSHVHNYERFRRDGVTYLVSGGGGANPVPAFRMFGELSHLTTAVNFHYLRFVLEPDRLAGTMVRLDVGDRSWSEPDRFEIRTR